MLGVVLGSKIRRSPYSRGRAEVSAPEDVADDKPIRFGSQGAPSHIGGGGVFCTKTRS